MKLNITLSDIFRHCSGAILGPDNLWQRRTARCKTAKRHGKPIALQLKCVSPKGDFHLSSASRCANTKDCSGRDLLHATFFNSSSFPALLLVCVVVGGEMALTSMKSHINCGSGKENTFSHISSVSHDFTKKTGRTEFSLQYFDSDSKQSL